MFWHKLGILSVILLLCISAVKGLQCLFCTDAVLPTDCDTVLTCAAHETCFVDTIVSGTGRIRFNLGCRDTRQCTNQHLFGKRAVDFNYSPTTNASEGAFFNTNLTLKSRSGSIIARDNHHNERRLPGRSAEMLVCSECCSSTLCNNAACGSGGYPVQRGPVCSNCMYQNGTEDCDKITVCGMNQVCKLAKTTDPVIHQTRFHTGCENEAVCDDEVEKIREVAVALIGRRDTFKVGDLCFIKCCKTDLCNSNCDMTSSSTVGTSRTLPPTPTRSMTMPSTATAPSTEYCLSNPCQRGTCSEYHNTYKCTCNYGYWGRNCENAPLLQLSPDTTSATTTVKTAATTTTTTDNPLPTPTAITSTFTDCYDIRRHQTHPNSGKYEIQIWNTKRNIDVYCDMVTDGGGWTIFQSRFDGSVDFYRNFNNYTFGFGDISGEFWLGLEYMHKMLLQGKSELRIDVSAADGSTAYEVYQNFRLSPGPGYTLHIDEETEATGHYLALSRNNGFNFSTYDHNAVGDVSPGHPDNDNPAITFHGGFWYNHNSAYTNLNGLYLTPGGDRGFSGMVYYFFRYTESLKTTKMMFRRI